MSVLKLSNLNKVYPSGESALYNFNLETADKEFVVVLGGEKSGKSTLLRLICGLEDVTDGEVLIDGKSVTDAEPKTRDVAMVFKSGVLNPSYNVFDNLAYGARLRKTPEALVQERVKVVAGMLGLTEVLGRKPKTLTAAEKQRVAIGRAIVREPRLYLFDEPLAGLDEKLREEMLDLIINLQARLGGTFLYATKNLAEAMTIGTRIAVLKNGFLQQCDTPANLYDYPANEYVAFLIGAPTVNFIRNVVIERADGKYFAATRACKIELPENIVNRFEGIEKYANSGKSVTLGIRPEDAEISGDGQFKGKISKTDGGSGNYVEIDVAPDICLNVLQKGGEKSGNEAQIKINTQRIFVFDGDTALTLLKRDSGYKPTGFEDADFTPLTRGGETEIYERLKPKKQKFKR